MSNPYQPLDPRWFGLYAGSTSGDEMLFTQESVAHPAKMSRQLTVRCIEQMLAWGWLRFGHVLADPFGGRGTTALIWCAMHSENRAVTCELEPHFIKMQSFCKALAERSFHRPFHWLILQGDSRKFHEHLAKARENGGLVSLTSPPFLESLPTRGGDALSRGEGRSDGKNRGRTAYMEYGATDGQIGALGSPPYGDTEVIHIGKAIGDSWQENGEAALPATGEKRTRRYGATDGQIGTLPEGPEAAISSPPYTRGVIGAGQAEKLQALTQDPSSSLFGRDPQGAWFQAMAAGYVNSEGNIDAMPDGPDACLSSPVYENAVNDRNGIDVSKCERPGRSSQARLQGYQTDPETVLTSPAWEDSLASGDPLKKGGLFRDPRRSQDRTLTAEYAQAGLGSPPFEAQSGGCGEASRRSQPDPGIQDRCGYKTSSNGTSSEQIGTTQNETYATACKAVYQSLAQAGIRYVCLVTKNPTRRITGVKWCKCSQPSKPPDRPKTVILQGSRHVLCPACNLPIDRKGCLRRLDHLTVRLLRQSGYRVVGWRRAMLWETQAQLEKRGAATPSLFDELADPKKPKGRMSFFSLLHHRRGQVRAQAEDVWFAELVRPPGEGGLVRLASPPYAESTAHADRPCKHTEEYKRKYPGLTIQHYGDTEGQISILPD